MINQAIATRTKELAELEKKLKDINPALDALDQSALFNPFGLKSSGTKKVLQDIEAVKEEIKLLKTGLPDAKARDLTQEFNLQLDTLKKQNAELTNAVLREEVIGEEKKKEFDLEQQIAAIKKANEAAKRQAEIFKKIGDSIATGISDALVGAILQTKSLGEAAKGILNDIASQLLRLGINTFLSSTFGGIFSSLPTFANGGSPPVGRPSIVGEKGPELFVPSSAGTIIPSNQIGGGVTNNIVVNVDASGSNVEGNEQQSRELGLVLSTAIQAEIVQQKRPGGLLA